MSITLSVLVPSTDVRHHGLAQRLTGQLFSQRAALPPADASRTEVLVFTDTRSRSVGRKRNDLIQLAQGEYVAFVDDDDRLAEDYLASLLSAIDASHADVITFQVSVSLEGGAPKLCRYSMAYPADANTPSEYHRLPNHLMAVRRELALQVPFADATWGEDADYARRLKPLLGSEHAIGRVLYHYDYAEASSLTNDARTTPVPPPPPPASQAPVLTSVTPKPAGRIRVDLVVLSKASNIELKALTEHTIATAVRTAAPHGVNVIVVEQAPGVSYEGATTITDTGAFAYNRLANVGIAAGSAEWVVVANNDLSFHSGWLNELLRTAHPLMSPRDPSNRGQSISRPTEVGTINGKHLSGWCYMLKRSLWEAIGHLDEDFIWWCADDCVIEQVRLVGVQPMLVGRSLVTHLGSRTGKAAEEADMNGEGTLTWAMLWLLEQKYGARKFVGVPAYEAWRERQRQRQLEGAPA